MKKVSARRRHVPAFGEWNYHHGGYGYGDGDWPVTQYFNSAMQAGLVMALPPSPKPVKKWSGSATLELELEKQQQQQQRKVMVGLGEHGVKKQGKQSRVAVAGSHTTANYKACRVVKAVDKDLYEIPPDLLCHKPRKRRTRSLWMGCLGLNCIA